MDFEKETSSQEIEKQRQYTVIEEEGKRWIEFNHDASFSMKELLDIIKKEFPDATEEDVKIVRGDYGENLELYYSKQ